MTTLKLLPHYSAKSVRSAGKSYYVDEQGDRFPSVTTILNATKPDHDKQALLQWRSRLGAQAANQITRQASRRGVSLHKQIHRYLLGKAIELPEAVLPYWESIQPVLQDIDEVRLVEGTVFHYGLRYSGRVDCVASYRGTPCILDWKSADKPKKSPERLRDAPPRFSLPLTVVLLINFTAPKFPSIASALSSPFPKCQQRCFGLNHHSLITIGSSGKKE